MPSSGQNAAVCTCARLSATRRRIPASRVALPIQMRGRSVRVGVAMDAGRMSLPTAPMMAMPVHRRSSGMVSHRGAAIRMGPSAWCCWPSITKRSPLVHGGVHERSGRLTFWWPIRPIKMYVSDVTTLHARHPVANHSVAETSASQVQGATRAPRITQATASGAVNGPNKSLGAPVPALRAPTDWESMLTQHAHGRAHRSDRHFGQSLSSPTVQFSATWPAPHATRRSHDPWRKSYQSAD